MQHAASCPPTVRLTRWPAGCGARRAVTLIESLAARGPACASGARCRAGGHVEAPLPARCAESSARQQLRSHAAELATTVFVTVAKENGRRLTKYGECLIGRTTRCAFEVDHRQIDYESDSRSSSAGEGATSRARARWTMCSVTDRQRRQRARRQVRHQQWTRQGFATYADGRGSSATKSSTEPPRACGLGERRAAPGPSTHDLISTSRRSIDLLARHYGVQGDVSRPARPSVGWDSPAKGSVRRRDAADRRIRATRIASMSIGVRTHAGRAPARSVGRGVVMNFSIRSHRRRGEGGATRGYRARLGGTSNSFTRGCRLAPTRRAPSTPGSGRSHRVEGRLDGSHGRRGAVVCAG